MSDNIFTSHPHKTGETYFQHLFFTFKIAFYLLLTALAAITHGLLPFLCTYTASKRINCLHEKLQKRVHLAEHGTGIHHPH